MSYQVLARKYRPQSFEQVIGQEPVVRALTNALRKDRTAHAYLFSGIRGVGKTTSARLLAKALNCAEGPTPEPCGACDSCREVAEGSALDVIEIDAATYTKVENMREVLDKTRYSPARDRFKVYIVDEVHMLSASSFNALLKTLEEPPDHVVFILATTELRKVPATIVSRCQHFEFRPVPHATLVEHLGALCDQEDARVTPAAVSLIARRAGGSVRDSQSLLDLVLCYGGEEVDDADAARILGVADARALSGILAAMGEGDAAAALERLDELLAGGADPVQVHAGLVEHLRNLMILRVMENPAGLLAAGEDEIAEWRELAQTFGEAELMRLLHMLSRGEQDVRYAAQPRYLLEGLVVRCSLLDRLADLEEVLRGLEGGLAGPSSGGSPGEGTAPGARKGRAARPARSATAPPASSREKRAGSGGQAGGTRPASLAEAVERASLKRWLRQVEARVEGSSLVLVVHDGGETVGSQLRRKAVRAPLLEAGREVFQTTLTDLEVHVDQAAGAAEEAARAEPPAAGAGGEESPEPTRGPEEADQDQESIDSLIDDTPAVQTLLDVFQGEIAEVAEPEDPAGEDRSPDS